MTTKLMLPKLPIGQQSFRMLRENGYLYIDKTDLVLQMIEDGGHYFLTRPRRMGKSLLVSLLQELFEGRRELFEGLAITKSDYDFKPYPVIRLDLGACDSRSVEQFASGICAELQRIAAYHGLTEIQGTTPCAILINLVRTLADKERVVLLIDEYNLPVVSNIEDPEKAKSFLTYLADFYSVVKALSPHLRFTLVTGVGRVSLTTIASGMNHLRDISLQEKYATLLGVTEEEVTRELLPFVRHIAEKSHKSEAEVRQLMRHRYNGYRFSREATASTVYIPQALFSFFKQRGRLSHYWCSTGSPSFVLDLIQQEKFPVEYFEQGLTVSDLEIEQALEPGRINIVALLFQTGYLTISHYDKHSMCYTLGFPNAEVRHSLLEAFSSLLVEGSVSLSRWYMQEIKKGLHAGDVQPIIEASNELLGKLSRPLQRRDRAWYHSLMFVVLRTIGLPMEKELGACKERLDMGLCIGNKAYIFEFKSDSSAAEAIQRIHDQQYARTYAGLGLEVYLVGININSESCCIDDWAVEQLPL